MHHFAFRKPTSHNMYRFADKVLNCTMHNLQHPTAERQSRAVQIRLQPNRAVQNRTSWQTRRSLNMNILHLHGYNPGTSSEAPIHQTLFPQVHASTSPVLFPHQQASLFKCSVLISPPMTKTPHEKSTRMMTGHSSSGHEQQNRTKLHA